MYRFHGGVVFCAIVAAANVGGSGCGKVASAPDRDAAVPPIDATTDATRPGAGSDAPPVAAHKFEVGYIDELTLAPTNRVLFGFILIANVGNASLPITDLRVKSFADDSPAVEWELKLDQGSDMPIAAGHAAGLISPGASDKIVKTGLVSEPDDDTFLSLEMSFVTEPPANMMFHAEAEIQIAGEVARLPFTIHIGDAGTTTVSLQRASRVSSAP
jgi:hypothetical protein